MSESIEKKITEMNKNITSDENDKRMSFFERIYKIGKINNYEYNYKLLNLLNDENIGVYNYITDKTKRYDNKANNYTKRINLEYGPKSRNFHILHHVINNLIVSGIKYDFKNNEMQIECEEYETIFDENDGLTYYRFHDHGGGITIPESDENNNIGGYKDKKIALKDYTITDDGKNILYMGKFCNYYDLIAFLLLSLKIDMSSLKELLNNTETIKNYHKLKFIYDSIFYENIEKYSGHYEEYWEDDLYVEGEGGYVSAPSVWQIKYFSLYEGLGE